MTRSAFLLHQILSDTPSRWFRSARVENYTTSGILHVKFDGSQLHSSTSEADVIIVVNFEKVRSGYERLTSTEVARIS